MARIIQHRHSENKRLFDYNSLAGMDDCDDLIVCMSERSLNIILNSMTKIEEFNTRLYTDRDGEYYTIASPEQLEEFRQWASTAYNELGSWVMCQEQLERIATSLEQIVSNQDQQTVNIFDVIEAMGLDPSDQMDDLIEAFTFLAGLFPTGLTVKVPLNGLIQTASDMRFRGSILNLLQDIAVSQRGQTVAQGGVDMAGLYDLAQSVENTLLLSGGWQGKALAMFKMVKPIQVSSWFGWIATLTGQLLGSIRSATYDIVTAIEEKVIPDYTTTLENLELAVNVTCKSCGSSGGCSCGGGGTGQVIDDDPATGQDPETPGGGPGGYPPPTDWDGTEEEYSSYKCQAANYIYDSIRSTLNYVGGLHTAAGAIAAGAALGSWLLASVAAYSPIGVIGVSIFAVLTGWEVALIVGLVATASILVGGSILLAFSAAATELEARKEEFVCKLYNAPDVATARSEAGQILAECADVLDVSGGPLADFATEARELMGEVLGYFLPNTLLNRLFTEDIDTKQYTGGTVNCSSCSETGPYTVVTGTELTTNPANPVEIDPIAYGSPNSCLEVLINFHQPVRIDGILFQGTTGGNNFDSCGAFNRFWYYSSEDQANLIYSHNGLPQGFPPFPENVRCLYARWEGNTPLGVWDPGYIIISYTPMEDI